MGCFQNIFTKLVLITVCLLGLTCMKSSEADSSLATQCGNAIVTVQSCLGFASGKAPEPTKECCNAVSSMKQKQPVCLCFFIDQVHNGSNPQIKSFGIQEVKLIQLPSACHLANASVAECPKLLGISPSSPEAAIFMHNNTASPPGTTASSSSATPAGDNSSGFKHKYGFLGGFFAVFISVFLCNPSVGNLNFLV